MTKYIFALALSVSFLSAVPYASAVTSVTEQTLVTGVVEHVESMENEAMVKMVGIQKLLIIKNLMSFPEAKLNALIESQSSQKVVKLRVMNNQIVDVLL